MMGFQTIRMGQRAAIWDIRGAARFVDGPRRIFLFRETIQWLSLYTAGPGQYLSVCYRDGRVEHIPGPVSIWGDPVKHISVEVREPMSVDANEAVVVYRREPDASVSRRVVRGPALFVPPADEWLHEFVWHGTDPKNPPKKVPYALRFNRLRVIPDQMYFDVEDVRTADDALLTIRLMVFFELRDIERMLDQTHDPVADFINAMSADVIDFVVRSTFEQFKEKTEALNDLGTYRQLVERAKRIGYDINKVVYRGYHANPKLQAMHDGAIEARTKLRLESETEQQAQELEDLKLRRDAERATQRRAVQQADAEHQVRLSRTQHDELLRKRELETRSDLEARRAANNLELDRQKRVNAEQAAFLDSMKGMNVDLTRYLVAQYQNPDRLIRVEQGATGGPQLHLHEN
jgi:hypothetical protein